MSKQKVSRMREVRSEAYKEGMKDGLGINRLHMGIIKEWLIEERAVVLAFINKTDSKTMMNEAKRQIEEKIKDL